ncbi:hypothetical protein NCR96_08025 [Helicobacter sp. 14348-15]|nr:hypothetical protein [Helicobacter colisuis]MCL9821678.1 hypothetical protein [Helicobacter colisuis]
MRAILQKIEEFLSKRTLRERILVVIFFVHKLLWGGVCDEFCKDSRIL